MINKQEINELFDRVETFAEEYKLTIFNLHDLYGNWISTIHYLHTSIGREGICMQYWDPYAGNWEEYNYYIDFEFVSNLEGWLDKLKFEKEEKEKKELKEFKSKVIVDDLTSLIEELKIDGYGEELSSVIEESYKGFWIRWAVPFCANKDNYILVDHWNEENLIKLGCCQTHIGWIDKEGREAVDKDTWDKRFSGPSPKFPNDIFVTFEELYNYKHSKDNTLVDRIKDRL